MTLQEEELLNKVVIFVFFAHKMYSRNFVKLCFWAWEHFSYIAAYGGSESSQISEDERRSYGFGTT